MDDFKDVAKIKAMDQREVAASIEVRLFLLSPKCFMFTLNVRLMILINRRVLDENNNEKNDILM